MSEVIFRGVRPGGADSPPRYNVKGPTRSATLDATILGHDVLGVPAHWAFDPVLKKRRSFLCGAMSGECQFCGVEPLTPLYFVAAYDHVLAVRFILRLGREGATALEACANRAGTLRGLRVEMYDSVTQAGREIVCVVSRRQRLTPLPAPHVIDPVVARLFKVPALPGWLTRREMPDAEGGAQ